MVMRRQPQYSQPVVVKPARPRARYLRSPRCIWPGCNAILAHDHDSPICSCHVTSYNLAHDKDSADLVLHLLVAAYPFAVDLSSALRARPAVVKYRVQYLRRRGHTIAGCAHGYLYELPRCAPQRALLSRTVKGKRK